MLQDDDENWLNDRDEASALSTFTTRRSKRRLSDQPQPEELSQFVQIAERVFSTPAIESHEDAISVEAPSSESPRYFDRRVHGDSPSARYVVTSESRLNADIRTGNAKKQVKLSLESLSDLMEDDTPAEHDFHGPLATQAFADKSHGANYIKLNRMIQEVASDQVSDSDFSPYNWLAHDAHILPEAYMKSQSRANHSVLVPRTSVTSTRGQKTCSSKRQELSHTSSQVSLSVSVPLLTASAPRSVQRYTEQTRGQFDFAQHQASPHVSHYHSEYARPQGEGVSRANQEFSRLYLTAEPPADLQSSQPIDDDLPATSLAFLKSRESISRRHTTTSKLSISSTMSDTSVGPSRKNCRCTNCGTQHTTMWRISKITNLKVCNPCGLYERTHCSVRPVDEPSKPLGRRNRTKSANLLATTTALHATDTSPPFNPVISTLGASVAAGPGFRATAFQHENLPPSAALHPISLGMPLPQPHWPCTYPAPEHGEEP